MAGKDTGGIHLAAGEVVGFHGFGGRVTRDFTDGRSTVPESGGATALACVVDSAHLVGISLVGSESGLEGGGRHGSGREKRSVAIDIVAQETEVAGGLAIGDVVDEEDVLILRHTADGEMLRALRELGAILLPLSGNGLRGTDALETLRTGVGR